MSLQFSKSKKGVLSNHYLLCACFYNPKIVKKLSNITLALSNLTIAKDTGFWRDFGFGMTCQYKKHFMNINGFQDLAQKFSHGWGDDDLFLYRKYIRYSNIKVILQIAPSLLHFFHEKDCDQNLLNNLLFKHCLTKIFNEASYLACILHFYSLNHHNHPLHIFLPYLLNEFLANVS